MLLSDACQREVGVFSLFICFDATNFVLLGPFTLEKRFALKKWGQNHFKKQQHKSTLPVDVRHSKILSLKQLSQKSLRGFLLVSKVANGEQIGTQCVYELL